MNAEQRAAALALAGKGVQVDDGHTYGVLAADLVAYSETIRALVAELDRVAPACSRVEDVRCAPCMTGAVGPVTGVAAIPTDEICGVVRDLIEPALWAWFNAHDSPWSPSGRTMLAFSAPLAESIVRAVGSRGAVTDAEVDAALTAYAAVLVEFTGDPRGDMRVALEAARAVGS